MAEKICRSVEDQTNKHEAKSQRMTGKRNVSKPVRFEEEFGYQTTLKCHAKKSQQKKQREDKKLYDCEIVEVDVANSRFKLHFVGYADSDDQWQTFTEDELPVLRRIKPFEFSRETLEERTEAFKSALYTELKKRLLPTTRKDDPAVRVELPVQRDVYESVFCSVEFALKDVAISSENQQ